MKKVLMYSGGMDSWIIDKLWKPDIKVFVNFHTPSAEEEIKRLSSDVIIKDIDLKEFEVQDSHKLMPLRNLLLSIIGSYYGDEICLGSIGGSVHYDNTPEFAAKTTELLNMLYKEQNRTIEVVLPYAGISKTELIRRYKEVGGDLNKAYNESFSCYEPINGKECGKCPSCLQKIEAFKNNGFINVKK